MSEEIVQLDKWKWLPSDLLQEIGKHLESSKDYVRFGATCKPWNMSLPKTPNHIRGPLLVLPFNHETYDIKEEKDFFLRLQQIQNNDILLRGSCFGWLIGIRIDGVIQMLNPFTNTSYDLPPMSTIPSVVEYHPELKDQEYTIKDYSSFDGSLRITFKNKSDVRKMVEKIVISSSPSEELIALAIYGEWSQLAWCKFGDTKWTAPKKFNVLIVDAIFYEGKVYAINHAAQLSIFDVTTSIGGITQVPKPNDLYMGGNDVIIFYLVRNVDGDLLMVSRFLNYRKVNGINYGVEFCHNTENFEVYKLDKLTKKWRRILSIGDYVIVVGSNSSVCMLPFSDGKGNWVRNCIYFSDNHYESQYNGIVGGQLAMMLVFSILKADKSTNYFQT